MEKIAMASQQKMCVRCIMDTSDPEISFSADGVCNHCRRYEELLPQRVHSGSGAAEQLEKIVRKMKADGKNGEYDCLIGVSGGVDSTYVAYLTKKLGLRPVAVHFDNGWNSELAVSNIEKTLKKLGIDLITYVIDWEEFRDLQLSFLKASTPDGEIPTDHAINALLFRQAKKLGIRYIINGMNFSTEAMSVPAWAYGHSDWKYIRSVHARFGTKSLDRYPYFSLWHLLWWTLVKKIKVVSILNYIDYQKKDVMETIQNELGWVYYGGKHYESVYTRFFQGYILPEKFGIDKRRGHLSDLILSGQLTRDEALKEIEQRQYSTELMESDKNFVIKKFELDADRFRELMTLPVKSYKDYPNNAVWISRIKSFVNFLRQKGLYSK